MDGATQIRLINFRIGPESFVLDIMAIRQIIAYSGSTSIPRAPSFIEGIVVLRNEVIPIIDLRQRLYPDLPPLETTPLVLVIRMAEGTIGLKVDEVQGIVTVEVESILPAPPLIRGIEGELLVGIVPHGEEVALLIDVASILTPREKQSLQEVDLSAVSQESGVRS